MKQLVLSLLLASLLACATPPSVAPRFGNFIASLDAGTGRGLGEDAVRKLRVLYPPATTRFNLQHPATDEFGKPFIAALRRNGYAVFEVPAQGTKQLTGPGIDLNYVVDKAGDENELLAVWIGVNDQAMLTRVYQVRSEKLYAAGAWVKGSQK